MKCSKCGEEMFYSIGSGSCGIDGTYTEIKYICPKCHYEVQTISDNFNDLMYRAPFFQPNDKVTNYGWICPKCGAVLSPSTTECPYCTPHNKSTCGTISGITTGQTLKSSAQTSPDKITVTGNNITSQVQIETMVSK